MQSQVGRGKCQVRDGEGQDNVFFQLGFPFRSCWKGRRRMRKRWRKGRKTIENDKALHHWRLDAWIAHEGIKWELQSILRKKMQRCMLRWTSTTEIFEINKQEDWFFIFPTPRKASFFRHDQGPDRMTKPVVTNHRGTESPELLFSNAAFVIFYAQWRQKGLFLFLRHVSPEAWDLDDLHKALPQLLWMNDLNEA